MEDSLFKMDSIMHNPKMRETSQAKALEIRKDTPAHVALQQQSILSDSELTHFSYRLAYCKTIRLEHILELILLSSITEREKDMLALYLQCSGSTCQAHGQAYTFQKGNSFLSWLYESKYSA